MRIKAQPASAVLAVLLLLEPVSGLARPGPAYGYRYAPHPPRYYPGRVYVPYAYRYPPAAYYVPAYPYPYRYRDPPPYRYAPYPVGGPVCLGWGWGHSYSGGHANLCF